MKRPIGIRLDGCIYTSNGEDLSEEEFSNAFIEFIEEKGWYFGRPFPNRRGRKSYKGYCIACSAIGRNS